MREISFGSISTNLPSHPSPIDANAFLQADRQSAAQLPINYWPVTQSPILKTTHH